MSTPTPRTDARLEELAELTDAARALKLTEFARQLEGECRRLRLHVSCQADDLFSCWSDLGETPSAYERKKHRGLQLALLNMHKATPKTLP